MRWIARSIIAIGFCFFGAGGAAFADEAASEKLFRDRVAKIFERRCVQCHAAEESNGGLRLDSAALALGESDSGKVIVAGDPDSSLLLDYISGDEPQMPKDAKPLSAEEVAAIGEWIAKGAKWPADLKLEDKRFEGDMWWSLAPLVKPAVPKSDSPWIRTPVDAFVLEVLKKNSLSPSAEADRRTLIRRLTFDLHGLPPTYEEVEAFVADEDPKAYEKLVDRLLESPRYGERWGRHWLDAVHYGDTHGYDKDKVRSNAWPYRDYVIRSFNEGKRYTRFVEEQLAGDVLYGDTTDGVTATGFITAGPWDFVGHVELREGTTDKEITRSLDRDDMLMNTMSTFTSLTVHCARCHNHKFDPIPQKDYYRLQAVFAGVERANRPYDADPKIAARRDYLKLETSRMEILLGDLKAQVNKISTPELVALDARIKGKSAEAARTAAEFPRAANRTLGYHSNIEPKADATKWVQVDLGSTQPIDRVILFPSHEVFGGHPGPGFGFPVRFKVEASDDAGFEENVAVIADLTAEDVTNPGNVPQVFKPGERTAGRYVRLTATKLWERTNDYALAISEIAVLHGGENIAAGKSVTALDSIESGHAWGRNNFVDGFFSESSFEAAKKGGGDAEELFKRLVVASASQQELAELQAERRRVAEAAIPEHIRRELAAATERMAGVKLALSVIPAQEMVYAAASSFAPEGSFAPPPNGKPREIRMLHRGSVAAPGEVVSPGTVQCVTALESDFRLDDPNDEGARRAALARWIVDEKNPLTWRSIVNRVWQYHFGTGIVASANDFGRMGAVPTHPELLDWLAAEFRDGDQSLKTLHKLLVTSAVYRQVSSEDDAKVKIDAGNRYLWRMSRRRLEAEAIRDATLAVAGKLDTTMGGPGFREFGFKDDHSPHYKYQEHDPDDPKSHRRSVYRFIVRSVPDPFMDTLDCADASLNVAKRNETVTALQALALLNNKFMLRMAEHLAANAEKAGDDREVQINAAFRLAFGRDAEDGEKTVLAEYVKEHGLANACRVILNLNEFVFVD
jgi:mono/diheme cytochrome c family protein